MLDLADLAAWREIIQAIVFSVLAKARRTQRNSYGMLDLADLAAWREIIQARVFFCSRKGAKGAKEFLRKVGLGGLGGLARDNSGKRFSCGIKEELKT